MENVKIRVTDEEIAFAKSISLTGLARSYGLTPVRVGHYYSLKEFDSIRIYEDKTYSRFSDHTGGSQIDFVMKILEPGLSFTEAVKKICDLNFHEPLQQTTLEKSEHIKQTINFVPPQPADDYKRLYGYLIKKRHLSKRVVDKFVYSGKIYETAEYHNIAFCSKASDGSVKHIALKGTSSYNGKSFRGDAEGSDKSYGFSDVNKSSKKLIVFEAAIDLMSYIDISNDYTSNKLAMNGCADNPLETFLRDYDGIEEIVFALDMDKPGITAANELSEKYSALGYKASILEVPGGAKDWNEYLTLIDNNKQLKKGKSL
ncbi:MAG: DUF3991 domain-containing protein [Lachnospiraceae bacterium]|nr:DUF3991 domain-containing protein [Lachnospiraceae bacterium]